MAQMSLNVGGGMGWENFAQLLLGGSKREIEANVVGREAFRDALHLAAREPRSR